MKIMKLNEPRKFLRIRYTANRSNHYNAHFGIILTAYILH